MQLSRAGADFVRFYNATRNNIFLFCQALNFSPTPQQVGPLRHIQGMTEAVVPADRSRYMAIKSGQGCGKTAVVAIIALWRAWRNTGALSVVTAPTMRQCKEVFLAELRAQLKKASMDVQKFFEVRATEVEILGIEDWGIKTVTAVTSEAMSGWHNEWLTFIFDEAAGATRPIHETILGTLTNVDKLYVKIGNPNIRDCPFFDCFNMLRDKWTTFTFNSEDTKLVAKSNIQRLEETYGRESDVFRVRVLGEFPLQDPTCVMGSDDLEACTRNSMVAAARLSRVKQFGIDFAQFGDDDSLIYRRSGLSIVEWKTFTKARVDRVIATAFEMQRIAGWSDEECTYVPDFVGMGDGAGHHFYNAGKNVFEFKANRTAAASRQYHDMVTEAFFGMAELVRKRLPHIPDDPELIKELSTRQYYLTLKGKLKIESKKEYKKRVQAGSPDRADGCVQCFYDVGAQRGQLATGNDREDEDRPRYEEEEEAA